MKQDMPVIINSFQPDRMEVVRVDEPNTTHFLIKGFIYTSESDDEAEEVELIVSEEAIRKLYNDIWELIS